MTPDHTLPTVCLNHTYDVIKQLGDGAFGTVFLAKDKRTQELVAVKLAKKRERRSLLTKEAGFLKALSKSTYVPTLYWSGDIRSTNTLLTDTVLPSKEASLYGIVMQLVGTSIEDMHYAARRALPLPTVMALAVHMIKALREVHDLGILHRDIKPHNFALSQDHQGLFILDFGLSKWYIDPVTKSHIPFKEHCSLTGTSRFVSVRTHLGIEQSRRDDLEALGYMLVYLAKGFLPWQGLPGETKEEKHKNILDKKMAVSLHRLCKGLPRAFYEMLKYTRNQLEYEESPDYDWLISMFEEGAPNEGSLAHVEWRKTEPTTASS